MHFKSISERIWVTFSITIAIIIFSISLIYAYSYFYLTVINQKSDLLTIHHILTERTFDEKIDFDQLKNLKESSHFIFKDDKIVLMNTTNKQPEILTDEDFFVQREIIKLTDGNNVKDKFIDTKIKGIRHLIFATSLQDGYFVSYMPIYRDNKIITWIILLGLVILIGVAFVTLFISNSLTKPLKELEKFTESIGKKDFSNTIEIKSNDEIGHLAQSMIKMQNDLKKVDIEEKKFLQSISHDLKTPVAVIIAHADSILDGIYVDSVENTAEIIKQEAILLNKKIKKLLYFNTLDFTLQNEKDIEKINLKELLYSIVSRFQFLNPNLQWNLSLNDAFLIGNYDNLSVSIENILDNAIRYAKSQINISLTNHGNKIYLNIFNDGEQIKQDAIDKIFNNLYKDKKGNFGLGLAISKKIINYYNGQISVQNIKNGVNFNIIFATKNRKNIERKNLNE